MELHLGRGVRLENSKLYSSVGLDKGPHPGAQLDDSGPQLPLHEVQFNLFSILVGLWWCCDGLWLAGNHFSLLA